MKNPFTLAKGTIAFALALLLLLTAAGCGGKKYAAYQCPMKCEEGKTYPSPGKCPVCEMDLAGIETLPDSTK
jgi:hypothetical protein